MSEEERKAKIYNSDYNEFVSQIRKITRAQLEAETITAEELDHRLTSFIDKHFIAE